MTNTELAPLPPGCSGTVVVGPPTTHGLRRPRATAHPATVVVEDLRKTYGSFAAVDGMSLEVASGSVVGLLGPDGAGKTTMIRMLLGMTRPTSGRATVLGAELGTPEFEAAPPAHPAGHGRPGRDRRGHRHRHHRGQGPVRCRLRRPGQQRRLHLPSGPGAVGPRRGRLLATKVAVLIGSLLAASVVLLAIAAGAMAVLVSNAGTSFPTDTLWPMFASGTLSAVTIGLIAFGLSLIARSDSFAMIGVLALPLVLDPVVGALASGVERFTYSGAISGVTASFEKVLGTGGDAGPTRTCSAPRWPPSSCWPGWLSRWWPAPAGSSPPTSDRPSPFEAQVEAARSWATAS